MNKSVLFIIFLIAGASCSKPDSSNDLLEVHRFLLDQKRFYYNVKYSLINATDKSNSSLYGTVYLNRNTESGISTSYFGLTADEQPNFLQSMHLQGDWIYDLSSNFFDLENADVLFDSLHSPLLINPNVLLMMRTDSVNIARQEIGANLIKWTFDLGRKADQLILVWSNENKKIKEVEYKYDVNSIDSYSRKWSFDYLAKADFTKLTREFKYQNQTTHQPIL